MYEAPKDPGAAPSASTPATPASASAPVDATPPARPSAPWVVPSGWQERPDPAGMRAASYGVTLPDGREMDVSVVALGEQAGSVLDNVNRWRRELGLAEVAEAGLDALRSPVRIGRQDGFLYDLVSEGAGPGASAPVRTLAAMLPAGGMTVFFKAKGEARLVADEKKNFIAWLGSVLTGPAESAPATAGAGSAPAPSAGASDGPQWTVPGHWRDSGPRPMRLASFEIPGDGGVTGDVSVSSLGGDGGGLLANVNRWRGQVGLAPFDEAGLQAAAVPIRLASGQSGILVNLGGGSGSILAAVVPAGDRTWFFKLTAPPALITRESAAFRAFVESARL